MYGWGECRSKELNGQILMADPILVRYENPKIHYEYISTQIRESEEVCCVTAEYLTSGTHADIYNTCYDLTSVALRVGKAELIGTDLNLHEFSCNAYVKCKVDVPPDAVLLSAKLTIYATPPGGGPAKVRLRLIDSDDCPDFGTEPSCAFSPSISDAFGHSLINPWSGAIPANQDQISVDFSGGELLQIIQLCGDGVTAFDIKPLLGSFIGRPGYTQGNYVGIALLDDVTNVLGEYIQIPRQQQVPTIRINLRWAEAGYNPRTPPPKPPKILFHEKFYGDNQHDIPPSDEMGDNEPSTGTAAGINQLNWNNIFEDLTASDFKYCWFMPVPEIGSWYDPMLHGPTPLYGPDAHLAPYVFNECGTYDIPCSKRYNKPFRYGRLGQVTSFVHPGLRGCVGHADKPPLPAIEPMYLEGCIGYEAASIGLTESIIQQYEARTQTVRHVYSTLNNWYIEYTIHVKAWMVYGDHRSFLHIPLNYPPNDDPDDYGSIIHWNCWYEMHIKANWKAPSISDPQYSSWLAWVLAMENGFGGTVTPRYSNCNDLLLKCAGLPCAMGDTPRPPQSIQEDDCEDQVIPGRRLPCVEDGKYSVWYLPEWGSNHPFTPSGGPTIPQMPHYGLIHQFERIVRTDPNNPAVKRTDHGWMQVGFQANHPIVRGGTPLDPLPRNHVMQITPFKPLTAQDVPDSAYGYVEYSWIDSYNKFGTGYGAEYIFFIYHGQSAATVESNIDSIFGHDVSIVTKSASDPDVFVIEWTGIMGNFRINLEVNFHEAYPLGDFESEIIDIIAPSEGGLNDLP